MPARCCRLCPHPRRSRDRWTRRSWNWAVTARGESKANGIGATRTDRLFTIVPEYTRPGTPPGRFYAPRNCFLANGIPSEGLACTPAW